MKKGFLRTSMFTAAVLITATAAQPLTGASVFASGRRPVNTVNLSIDGSRFAPYETESLTIGGFLSEQGIELGSNDSITPSIRKHIENNLSISIITASQPEEEEPEEVPARKAKVKEEPVKEIKEEPVIEEAEENPELEPEASAFSEEIIIFEVEEEPEVDAIDAEEMPEEPDMPPEEQPAAQGRLTGSNVRVRENPSLDSGNNVLFQATDGLEIEILDVEGDFFKVNIDDNRDVYIFREFVDVTEAVGIPETAAVPVMAAPNSYEGVLGVQEDALSVTGRYGDWYEVSFNGEVGFVESVYLDVAMEDSLKVIRPTANSVSVVSESDSALVSDVIEYAKGYLGVPYRYGSADPRRGFDCSGFVTTVMRRFGINLNRSSASMAYANGTSIGRGDLKAGDLVFFATGGGRRISHVGIYIGNEQFIHSATNRGVMISGMGEAYYRSRYVTASRVL